MKVAFDVDVLAKQMSIKDMVYKVADWGYKYIEQSPHPRINPFYKHPLFSKECEAEYHAVANWKKIIEIAVNMGVPVINTEFSGDPNQQEICNGMWFRSMEELLPIIEKEGLRVEVQSHPYDFCELNDEACDLVKSFRSPNLGYVYSASHGFFYDQGKGDVRHMLKYAGYLEPDQGLPLHPQPAVAQCPRQSRCHHPPAHRHGRGRSGLCRHLRDTARDGFRKQAAEG